MGCYDFLWDLAEKPSSNYLEDLWEDHGQTFKIEVLWAPEYIFMLKFILFVTPPPQQELWEDHTFQTEVFILGSSVQFQAYHAWNSSL